MEKKKALLYPYSSEMFEIAYYTDLINDYNIEYFVSPQGFFPEKSDCGISVNSKNLNKKIYTDFEEICNLVDAVIICEIDENLLDLLNKIKYAIDMNKQVVCCFKCSNEIKNIIKSLEKQNNQIVFNNTSEHTSFNLNYKGLEKINTPIVFVAGMGVDTRKYFVQLGLKKFFQTDGYKVVHIGTRNNCNILFDSYDIPEYMFYTQLDSTNKILNFNRYIKNIEITQKPDVIIIGIPFGITTFNEQLHFDFGSLAFELSQSVQADFTIFNLYYDSYEINFFEQISNIAKYRLGNEIDIFVCSNVKPDWAEIIMRNEMEISYLNDNVVKDQIALLNNNNYNVIAYNDVFNLYEKTLKRLNEFSENNCI